MGKKKKCKKKWKNGFFLFLVAVVCQSQFSAVQAAFGVGGNDDVRPTAAPVSKNQAVKAPEAESSGECETRETPSGEPKTQETKSQEEESPKVDWEEEKTGKTDAKEEKPVKTESQEEKTGKADAEEDKMPKTDSKEEKSSGHKSSGNKSGESKYGEAKSTGFKFSQAEQNPNESFIEEFQAREASSGEELPEVKPLSKPFEDVLKETREYILGLDTKPDYSSQWFALGLARGGMDLDDKYFNTFYENMAAYIAGKKGKLHRAKYSEYSKAILALTAMGIDAQKVNGYNLFEYLADFTNVKRQGFNGPIWALMALNSHPAYEIPKVKGVKEQTTEEGLVKYLLEREMKGGGWAMQGDKAEVDITGMTIQALSAYYQRDGYENVTEAIDRAVEVLSERQNAKTGGYATMGADNVESCVQVVVALCSIGVDPRTDERFIKNKNWTIADLLSYHKGGSGFMHVKPGGVNNGGAAPGAVDGMATEQGHYAMVAYQRLQDGKTFLYHMSDVTLREGWKVAPMDFTQEESVTPTPSPKPTKTPGAQTDENIQNPTVPPEEKKPSVSVAQAPAAKPKTATVTKAATSKTAKTASTSSNASKKKKKKSDSEDSGWNFEGAAYTDDSSGWDFAASEEGNADAEVAAEDVQEERTSIPPFDRAVAGGIIGAAAFEGFKSVFQRKRGRKI